MANKLSQRSQYFAALAAAVGAMAHSTAVAWATPTGPVKLNDLELTDEQVPWVGSTLTFAAGSMCILTGFLTNFIGRKTAMLLLVIPFTFGWTLIIFAKNFSMVIVGRALLGVATGGVCVVVPIYIGEIAETQNRGILCSLFQLLSTAGTLFVYVAGASISTSRLSVFCAAIPLIFGILVLFCPESPTYLMQKNRSEDACRALLWLRGNRYDPSTELKTIQATLKQQPLQQRREQQQTQEQQQSQKPREVLRGNRFDPSIELNSIQAVLKQQLLQQRREQQQTEEQQQSQKPRKGLRGNRYDPSIELNSIQAALKLQSLQQRREQQQTEEQQQSQKPRKGLRGNRYVPSIELNSIQAALKQQPLQQRQDQQQTEEQQQSQNPRKGLSGNRYVPSIELNSSIQAALKQQPLQQRREQQQQQTEEQQQSQKLRKGLRGNRYDPSIELNSIQAALEQQPLQQRREQQQTEEQQQSQKLKEGLLLWSRKQFQQHQYKEVLKSTAAAMLRRSSVKALSISYGLFTCQQMCGINILVFYTTDIFAIAGTQLSPHLSTALIGVVATFFSALLVDRLGRRKLLLTSQIVITICTFSLGYYFRMNASNANTMDQLNWFPLSMLCLFTIAFSIGLGPVPWVMLGELFPPDIKGLAGSISTSANLTLAFISTKTYKSLSDIFGVGGVFWLYTCFSLLGTVFVYLVVPETMGKSLNNIQNMINEVEDVSAADSGAELTVENGNNLAMKQLRNYHKNGKSFTL